MARSVRPQARGVALVYVTSGRGRRKRLRRLPHTPGRPCARTKPTTSSCAGCARRASSPRSRPCSSGTRRPTCRRAGSRAGASSSRSWPGLLHDRGTDPRLGELLAAVEGSDLLADPATPAAVNVRLLRREYDRFVRLPRRLVEEVARTTTLAQKIWAAARGAGDFQRFRPWLERIVGAQAGRGGVRRVRRRALRRAAGGLRAGPPERRGGPAVRRPQARAGAAARPHRRRAPRARPLRPAAALPARPPAPLRRDGGRRRRLRFRPRPHGPRRPSVCTAIGLGDCRINLRLDERDFAGGLFTILHEVGHGLYEQGLEPEHYGTPLGRERVGRDGRGAGAVLGESGRAETGDSGSTSTRARAHLFPESLGDVPLDEFHFAVNRVSAVAHPGRRPTRSPTTCTS